MSATVNGPGGAVGSTPRSIDPAPRGAAEKALDLLATLAASPEPQRLLGLAERTGLPKATAHRMLNLLCDTGYAVASAGGIYHAGPKLLGIAASALSGSPERPFVRAALLDLQQRTGHSAHYVILNGETAIYIDKVEAEQAYQINTRIGQEVPLSATAYGRALQEDPAEWIDADDGSRSPIRSVAVPVRDGLGLIIGAIGISGLTFTLGEESVPVFGPLLLEASQSITRSLGGDASGTTAAVGE